jgi:hypothetical protein
MAATYRQREAGIGKAPPFLPHEVEAFLKGSTGTAHLRIRSRLLRALGTSPDTNARMGSQLVLRGILGGGSLDPGASERARGRSSNRCPMTDKRPASAELRAPPVPAVDVRVVASSRSR